MEKASKIISRREFDFLSQFNNHSPEEKEKLEAYLKDLEEKFQHVKIKKQEINYIDGYEPTKSNIWKMFLLNFKIVNGKDFIQTPDSLQNIEPLIKYFSQDADFLNCKNLIKEFEGVELKPNFKKGLLIIGPYGNGKTSILKSLSTGFTSTTELAKKEYWKSFTLWNRLRFNCHNANDVVTEFECIERAEYKEEFYKKYSGFRLYFDDFKNEKIASNFGKTELFREIIEKRYNNQAQTLLTMNYEPTKPFDLSYALDAIAKRYGEHIYDRLFEMFNIIEFKGKSFRK